MVINTMAVRRLIQNNFLLQVTKYPIFAIISLHHSCIPIILLRAFETTKEGKLISLEENLFQLLLYMF
jgi:hypothetical protein